MFPPPPDTGPPDCPSPGVMNTGLDADSVWRELLNSHPTAVRRVFPGYAVCCPPGPRKPAARWPLTNAAERGDHQRSRREARRGEVQPSLAYPLPVTAARDATVTPTGYIVSIT